MWFFCHMPETRGCELEEIEELFTRGSKLSIYIPSMGKTVNASVPAH